MTTVIPYSELNRIPVWNPMSNGTIISSIILTIKTVISQTNLPFELGWTNYMFESTFSIILPNLWKVALMAVDDFNMKFIHSLGK